MTLFILGLLFGIIATVLVNFLIRRRNISSAADASKYKMTEAVENERRRIASDFHDDIVASLSSLLSNIYVIREQVRGFNQDNVNERLSKMAGVADQNIESVRRIIFNLLPRSLETNDLDFAVRELCFKYDHAPHTPSIECKSFGQPAVLSHEQKLNIFRIIQELLNNSKKHSYARNIYVHLHWSENDLKVIVKDDGRGFPVHHAKGTKGFGLDFLSDRVKIIGATAKFNTDVSKGTEFELLLPLQKPSRFRLLRF